ncbi:dermatopontin-like [Biomphalaria glabrata]|uniref:Dermatopontin-like n=1 Tax=Biomphalaria glabrata TaxID=6526 RepID=A0A9W2ZA63_BIOGL|nr:dermatopontin-like [Biomphalaria glabrata]
MPTAHVNIFLLGLALVHGYVNEFDRPFSFKCGENKIISHLSSVHDNRFEDRVFDIFCRSVSFTRNCAQSDYVNDFRKPINFVCPSKKFLTGIESYHKNEFEDRRFRFTCCTASESPGGCNTTSYLNEYDSEMTFSLPQGQGIRGLRSSFNRYYHDRRWRLTLCKL